MPASPSSSPVTDDEKERKLKPMLGAMILSTIKMGRIQPETSSTNPTVISLIPLSIAIQPAGHEVLWLRLELRRHLLVA